MLRRAERLSPASRSGAVQPLAARSSQLAADRERSRCTEATLRLSLGGAACTTTRRAAAPLSSRSCTRAKAKETRASYAAAAAATRRAHRAKDARVCRALNAAQHRRCCCPAAQGRAQMSLPSLRPPPAMRRRGGAARARHMPHCPRRISYSSGLARPEHEGARPTCRTSELRARRREGRRSSSPSGSSTQRPSERYANAHRD